MSGLPAAAFRHFPPAADVAHPLRPLLAEPRRPPQGLLPLPHRLVHRQLREAQRPQRRRRRLMRM